MDDRSTAEQEILELGQQWAAADLRGDAASLDALLAEDFVCVGPLGFVIDTGSSTSPAGGRETSGTPHSRGRMCSSACTATPPWPWGRRRSAARTRDATPRGGSASPRSRSGKAGAGPSLASTTAPSPSHPDRPVRSRDRPCMVARPSNAPRIRGRPAAGLSIPAPLIRPHGGAPHNDGAPRRAHQQVQEAST
jgi:hypothetical protein